MDGRQLRCPACDGPMHQADRRGVLIDVCRDCRGVFLDRGELDKLIDGAADAPAMGYSAPAVSTPLPPPPPRGDDRYRDDRYRDDDRRYDQPRRKKKRGFLEEMFDFD